MAQFTNQATISYNGMTATSNIVTGEITQVLTMWKDATVGEYAAGDILTYAVSIQNSGAANYTGLTISDDLGAYSFGAGSLVPLSFTGDPVLYYINGVLQTAPAVTAGPPLVISGINVPAGQSSIIIYRTRVNDYAPMGAGGVINNTAVLTGGGLSESISADETVSAGLAASLSIIKALSPTSVVENGQLTYTFTIQNTGASAAGAAAGIVISDTFSPALTAPITVTLNGATWPQTGNYTYDAATGVFATAAGALTVPAAAFSQDPVSGIWSVNPGSAVLTVSGTI